MNIEIPETNIRIGQNEEVFVIAEIGKNFIQTEYEQTLEEYIENAKILIDEAAASGANAVKFQTHVAEDEQLDIEITSPHFSGSDRYSWVKRNESLTPNLFWTKIKRHCKDQDILFFSTPMSKKAAIKLEQYGVDLWKVGSGDVQDYVLLDYLIESKKPIIISTGMVSLIELDEVIQRITLAGAPLSVLYCVSKYPCPETDFNLATIKHLKQKYPNIVIGFSDHSIGFDASLAAIKLGATVIEKHFSLSRELWGSDHKVSLTPPELKEMVKQIRSGDFGDIDESKFLGFEDRELEGANNQFRPFFNKCLVAGENITKGTVLRADMIFAVRPKLYAGGLPSNQLDEVVGKELSRTIEKYTPITAEVLT